MEKLKITDEMKTREGCLAIHRRQYGEPVELPQDHDAPDIAARKWLQIIIFVWNGGRIVDFSDKSYIKYWPWIKFERSPSGLRVSYGGYGFGFAYSLVGARLCFFDSDHAKMVAELFIELYKDYMLVKNKITLETAKTYEDYLEIHRELYGEPKPKHMPTEHDSPKVAAGKKLEIIIFVKNGGKTVDFSDTSYLKYWPYFEYKKDSSAPSGLRVSYYDFDSGYAFSYVGARLCFFDSDHAEQIAKQQIDLYNDLMID